jgi:hypothetical protein
MRGTAAPFKPPKQKGAHPLLATPWCIILMGAAPKKWSLFLKTFFKRNSVCSLNWVFHFFHCLRPQKSRQNTSICGKRLTFSTTCTYRGEKRRISSFIDKSRVYTVYINVTITNAMKSHLASVKYYKGYIIVYSMLGYKILI